MGDTVSPAFLGFLSVMGSLLLSACQSLHSKWGFGNEGWEKIETPRELGALAHAYCAAVAGEFWVWGGLRDDSEDIWNTTVGLYSQDKWEILDLKDGPSARLDAALLATEQKIFVVAGRDREGKSLADAYHFSLASRRWQRIDTEGLPPRRRPSLTQIGRQLVLYGGRVDGKAETELYLLSLDTLRWSVLPLQKALPSRVAHAAIGIEGQLMIWGGMEGQERRGDGFLVQLSSGKVEKIPETNALTARARLGAFVQGEELLLWGGASIDQSAGSGAVYRTKSRQWQPLAGSPPSDLNGLQHAVSIGLPGVGFLQFGGRWIDDRYPQKVYLYDGQNWSESSYPQNPPGRIGHCLLWQKPDRVLLFGGLGPDEGWGHLRGLWRLQLQAL